MISVTLVKDVSLLLSIYVIMYKFCLPPPNNSIQFNYIYRPIVCAGKCKSDVCLHVFVHVCVCVRACVCM